MFETTFRNLDDTLRKDAGCSSELDYIEQTSWVLFLKYLDDFEADREASAQLNGERYQRILSNEYAWTTWAVGLLYAEGQGVVQDYAETVKWYKLAAAQGDAGAQFNLGWLYANGQGVVQDYAEAVKWWKLAVQNYVRAHMWWN